MEILIYKENGSINLNGTIRLLEQIQKFIDGFDKRICSFNIQNDGDIPPLGIIVDIYKKNDITDPAYTDSATFWFSNFENY